MIKYVDIMLSSNGGDLELCFNNCYELCGHCILSNMWNLYIVHHVDIVYCQLCGQLDIVQIVLTLCTIKHVDIVQSSNYLPLNSRNSPPLAVFLGKVLH